MIPANDLRIGNWVKNNYDIGNNNSRDEQVDIHLLEDILHDYANVFEPIPITPELLEKCGWVRYKGSDNDYTVWQKEEWYLELDWRRQQNGFDLMIECISNTHEFETIVMGIKHLHQLQNLFFALTGNELEITL